MEGEAEEEKDHPAQEEAGMTFGRDEWILAFILGVCALIGLGFVVLKYFFVWQDSF
jgi:hypothetical protein